MQEILDKAASQDLGPEFAGSYKNEGDGAVKQPNIIFVMNESFWDVASWRNTGWSSSRRAPPIFTG